MSLLTHCRICLTTTHQHVCLLLLVLITGMLTTARSSLLASDNPLQNARNQILVLTEEIEAIGYDLTLLEQIKTYARLDDTQLRDVFAKVSHVSRSETRLTLFSILESAIAECEAHADFRKRQEFESYDQYFARLSTAQGLSSLTRRRVQEELLRLVPNLYAALEEEKVLLVESLEVLFNYEFLLNESQYDVDIELFSIANNQFPIMCRINDVGIFTGTINLSSEQARLIRGLGSNIQFNIVVATSKSSTNRCSNCSSFAPMCITPVRIVLNDRSNILPVFQAPIVDLDCRE